MDAMQDKIKETISNIMLVPIEDLTPHSSPETIEAWDSLKHMTIILALEEEFNVRFNENQIENMSSVEEITREIEAAINA
jgi:acyl carrier protein